jgi:hypothetical protein
MAGTTTNFAISYPTSTDLVTNGATAIQTVAQGFDTRLGDVTNYPNQIVNVVSSVSRPVAYAMEASKVTIAAPSALNTISTASVTFTSGRFTQAPLIVISANTGTTNARAVVAQTTTTSGVTLGQWQLTGGTLQATDVHWIAIQMKSATAAG